MSVPLASHEMARALRRRSSEAEQLLWSKLRGRRLAGWKFRRQMPIGRYIVDFCCPDAWLVVEVDGGQHTVDAAALRDAQRTKELEGLGYFVLRFWNPEIFANLDGVCETILSHLRGEAGA